MNASVAWYQRSIDEDMKNPSMNPMNTVRKVPIFMRLVELIKVA